MRILLATSTFLPGIGGAEVAIHHLAEGLIALGHTVGVCAVQRRSGAEHDRSYELLRVTPPPGLGRTPLYDRYFAGRLRRVIAAWRPDVVHAHFAWPTGYAALAAREDPRLAIVLTSHGQDIQVRPDVGYGYRLDPTLEAKIRRAVTGADLLTAVGLAVREEYLRLGAEPKRVVPIPNGIAWGRLAGRRELRAAARTALRIPDERVVVLAVGRNHPKKGFADLIHVLGDLRAAHPEMMALFVGRNVALLRPLAEAVGLAEAVRFYEPARPAGIRFVGKPEADERSVETYFHASDLYAMTSLIEAAGIVTVEAMAAGLAVVARQAPGTEDLIQSDVTGLLVGTSREELTAGLARLLRDPSAWRGLGARAQERAREFDRVTVAERYLEAYEAARRLAAGG